MFKVLEQNMIEEKNLLGHIVMWRLGGIAVKHAALLNVLDAAGLAEFAPKEPTLVASIGRAVTAWVKDRAELDGGPKLVSLNAQVAEDEEGTGRATRSMIRKIDSKDSDWLVFSVITEDINLRALGLSYETDLRVLVHKTNLNMLVTATSYGEVDAESTRMIEVEQAIAAHWQYYKDLHTSGDLSRIVQTIVAGLDSVPLRKEGGVYFVPAKNTARIQTLNNLITTLPSAATQLNTSYFVALPQANVEGIRNQLAPAIKEGIMDELGSLRTVLQRFIEQQKNGSVRAETIQSRLDQYARVAEKLDLHADILGFRRSAIQPDLDWLQAKALELQADPGKRPPRRARAALVEELNLTALVPPKKQTAHVGEIEF